jgi:hypothetical protein
MASTAPLDFDSLDYYAEPRLIDDPNPYFEHLRAKGPVTPLPMHGVVAVTGFEEAVQVYTDVETSRPSPSRSTAATSRTRSRRGGRTCR